MAHSGKAPEAEPNKFLEAYMLAFDLTHSVPEFAIATAIPGFADALDGPAGREYVHLLYFLAYLNLADSYRQSGEHANEEILELLEKAVPEYVAAVKMAKYEEVETYSEEVVTKPAGFLRKKETQSVTKTRTVTKSSFDARILSMLRERIDVVLESLEKSSPGRAQELIGYAKLRYLWAADRVSWAPIIEDALEDGTISKVDMRTIADFPLPSSRSIRSAVVSWLGGGDSPKLLISCTDLPEPLGRPDLNITAMFTVEKENGTWVLSDTPHP